MKTEGLPPKARSAQRSETVWWYLYLLLSKLGKHEYAHRVLNNRVLAYDTFPDGKVKPVTCSSNSIGRIAFDNAVAAGQIPEVDDMPAHAIPEELRNR